MADQVSNANANPQDIAPQTTITGANDAGLFSSPGRSPSANGPTSLKVAGIFLVALIVIGFILPSGPGNGFIVTGTLGLGLLGAIAEATAESRRSVNKKTLVKGFSIIGGVVVAILIFFGAVIGTGILLAFKNPDALSC
jgi:hypothetical protein